MGPVFADGWLLIQPGIVRRLQAGLRGAAALSLLLCVAGNGRANDVQPRLFTNVPVGAQFLGFSYTTSVGNVAVDPNVALDVEADLHTVAVSYTRAFSAWGKSALVSVAAPYSDLTLSGIVDGERVSASDREFADPIVALAINLAGAPALAPEAFASYVQRTIVGLNFQVRPPLGDYDRHRTVNFGSNRWTVSSELGLGHRFGRFTLEAAASATFFSDNTEFDRDKTLKQEPVAIVRANVLYHFRRQGTWIGISSLYLNGGETTVDGRDRDDLQVNSRAGITLSVPFGRRHNVLFKVSSGVTTRIGADFDNYNLVYTYRL